MARPAPDRDPRFRRFRVAAYLAYLTVVSAFCLLVIGSVVRSVRAMSPRAHPSQAPSLDQGACAARAEALFHELDEHRRGLSTRVPAANADLAWTRFRVEWLEKVRQSESSCGVAAPDRASLARLFRQLEHLEDLYTTSAVQFSGEVGPAVDAFRRSLESVRR